MLLNITALTKTYTISGKLITALNTVDLTFSENSFTCIVGKSGCGKTTLLRLLSGFVLLRTAWQAFPTNIIELI